MRLPWPFNRSTDEPGTGELGAAEAGSPATDAALATDAPPARPTGAWTSLPPIQRAIGEPRLVAPAAPFLEGVPGARPLPPIVEPLGHDVSSIAPAGLVAAPVHAVPALTSSASLVPPPVQRRAAVSADAAGDHAPAPDLGPSSGGESASPPSAELPPTTPARTLGVVTPESTARPPDRPLTRAEPAEPGTVAGPPLVSRRTPVPSASRAASAAPAPPASPRSGSRGAPLVARSAAPGSSGSGSPPAGEGSQPRRPGLGAPLAKPPSHAVPAPGLPAVARQGPPTVSRTEQAPPSPATRAAAATRTPAPAEAPDLPAPRGFRATAGAAPLRTTIQRRTTGAGTDSSTAGHTDAPDPGGTAPLAGPTSAPRSGLPVLPVVRSRPAGAESGEHGARLTHDGVPSPAPATVPSAGPKAALPAAGSKAALPSLQRSANASSARPLPAAAVPSARRPLVGSRPPISSVQRSAAASESEESAQAGASLETPARHAAAPGDQNRAAWPLPGVEPMPAPGGVRSGSTAPVAPMGVQRSPSSRAATASPSSTILARSRAPAAAALSAAPQPASPSSPLGIIAAAPPPPVAAPSVQASTAAPVLAPTATAIVQRVDGAAPTPPPESDGHSDSELDELARKLFGRFQNRLRAEYIYEREAKGLTFDN